MIAMQYQHTEILHPAHSFGTKQYKEENQRFQREHSRGEIPLWDNGILRECVLTYKGEERDSIHLLIALILI